MSNKTTDTNKTEEITIRVLKETADGIRQHSENLKLSMGEIVDRLTFNFSTKDTSLASYLIIEYIGMVTTETC